MNQTAKKNKQKARKTTITKRELIYHKNATDTAKPFILRNSQNCQVYGLSLLFIECTTHRPQVCHSSYLFFLIHTHLWTYKEIQKRLKICCALILDSKFDKFETPFHGVQKVCLVLFLSPLANTQITLWCLSATSLISTRPLPTTDLSTGKHGWESCQQLHSQQPPKRTTLLHLQVRKTLQTQACYSTYFLCLENNGSIIT